MEREQRVKSSRTNALSFPEDVYLFELFFFVRLFKT